MEDLKTPANMPPIDESTISMWPDSLRYGLIGGLVLIIYSLCIISFDLLTSSLIMASLLGLLTFVLYIPFVFISIINHRKNSLGGYISFGRAFLVGLITISIMVVLHNGFSLIYNVIDPGYMENFQDFMLNALEEMNAPQAQIDEVERQFENSESIGSIIKNIFSFLIFGAIISLVAAAILKKSPNANEIES
ncbi:MAG: DUF4199 domain-containing protein [Saprospiraceae bacterium]